MYKISFIILALLFLGNGLAAQANFFKAVQSRDLVAEAPKTVKKMGIYRLNEAAMRAYLLQAPLEFHNVDLTLPLDIPLPDGTVETFNLVESPILAPQVADLYPEIKTYTGNGLTHTSAIIRLSLTSVGFNAIILDLDGNNVYFEDYAPGLPNVYFNYFGRDAIAPDRFNQPACRLNLLDEKEQSPSLEEGPGNVQNNTGATLYTFRLAMAATGEFTAAHGGTAASSFAVVVGYVNRMVAVYRRDLAITFSLVSTAATVYANAATDPYTNNDQIMMLSQNQTNLTNVIGTANFDVGHVLGTEAGSGGGVATTPSVCSNGSKARGVSGEGDGSFSQLFADQLLFHEVGHQFGMSHSYNSSSVPVCTTREPTTSVEPGSGATIMSYGFTCSGDNYFNSTQLGPILFFHTINYSQAVTIIAASCATTAASGNAPPTVTMPGNVTIPKSTPFVLTGSGSNAGAGDAFTYSWEGTNVGTVVPDATTLDDPAQPPFFRTYDPVGTPTRTFPLLSSILDGTNQAKGDKLPSVSIATTHRLTIRDNNAAAGGVAFGTTTITVDGGIGPFLITSNLAGSFPALSAQVVTWSVNGTNVATPNVKISLSADGGQTFPNVLAANTPNDGTESVILPNSPGVTTARIKVEAVGNIFFDISNTNFAIGAALPVELVRFEARLRGENTAVLSWQTATEVDNQGYDVEMSINDGTFRKMGFVQGKGTNNVASNYEFLVPNLSREVHYFRLKMKDLNGTFAYSPVRSLALGGAKDVVNIYPNPALDGVLQITLAQSDAEQIQAELINAIGQLVGTARFVNDGNIMRLHLPASGVYNLVLRLDNGTVITRRVVML